MTSAATAPLSVPAFRNLWLASILSNLGSFLQTVAASWLMLQLTGSPLWVGLMVASPTLPLLFIALPAGAMADLVDRRRILIVSQAIMAAAAAATALLWFLGILTPGVLLALGLLLGVGLSLSLPAWQAMVPDLVPSGQVAGAVALNSAAFNVARAVGPALGGIVVATAGPGAAFLANAASYLAVIAALATFRTRALDGEPESITTAIASGLRYARFTPAYRWLLLVASLFALTSAVLQAMLPNLTADVLGGGAATYGLLLGAMGVGALAGAFSRPWAGGRFGAAMVPASIAVFGLAGMGVGLSRTLPLAAVGMAVTGVLWVWILSTLNATAQLLSPRWVRGRIMSLYTLAFLGLLPVGSILAGALGSVVGPANAIVALSLGTVILGLAALRMPLPVLERVVTPSPPEDWEPVPHPSAVGGDPVMIVNTWEIDEDRLADYLAVMDELRLVRLQTGAFRWRLFRNVGDAHRMTEVFLLHSWEQHLRQHRRIDAAAADVIRRARRFDRSGEPETHHLAAIDVTDPAARPEWDALVAVHEELHSEDAIPLPGVPGGADGPDGPDGPRIPPAATHPASVRRPARAAAGAGVSADHS